MMQVDLWGSAITESNFREANLTAASLRGVALLNCSFQDADLTESLVHGCSAWDVDTQGAKQSNLIITQYSGKQKWRGTGKAGALSTPSVSIDNLEVAQFVYLILNNKKIRDVVDTVGKKAVLILGRFSPERKIILEEIRDILRMKGMPPMMFDFDKPSERNLSETVSLLARMARFVIADISEPSSVPQELQLIVPHCPSIPVFPILDSRHTEYGMFPDFADYPWVMPLRKYDGHGETPTSVAESIMTVVAGTAGASPR